MTIERKKPPVGLEPTTCGLQKGSEQNKNGDDAAPATKTQHNSASRYAIRAITQRDHAGLGGTLRGIIDGWPGLTDADRALLIDALGLDTDSTKDGADGPRE